MTSAILIVDNVNYMDRAAIVRNFNRFYTKQIHVLQEGILDSDLSLTEARILFEIAHREKPTAKEIADELALDAGYLSRIIHRFSANGWIEKHRAGDGRQRNLSLTTAGRELFSSLDQRSHQEASAMLRKLPASDQSRLITAMKTIESILEPQAAAPYVLRTHRPGDIGWITHRHGALYAQEYGWDEKFEALVAGIAAKFIENFDPKRERCWIAEQEGNIVGSVTLVKKTDQIAKLRLLYVEPCARGLGLGRHLVQECIRFAREAGYRKVTLWTNSMLLAARRIYEKEGFRLVKTEGDFETWDLKL